MESEIIDITESYLAKTGYKLVGLTLKGEKKNRIVELFLDSVDPVSLDELTVISRDLNEIFSGKDINSSISKLVVSSPGVDKPFKFHWQLNKHIGRTLGIIMNDDTEFEAILDDIDDDGLLTITKSDKKSKKKKSSAEDIDNKETKIKFTDIKESRVKIKF
jgi:ribosome maturation factor RimP